MQPQLAETSTTVAEGYTSNWEQNLASSIIHTVLLCRFAQYKLKGMEVVPSFQKATKASPCVALSYAKM